jgi:hypothetical protein
MMAEPDPTLESLDALKSDYALNPAQEILWGLAREAVEHYINLRDQIAAEGNLVPGRYASTPRAHPLLGALGTARAHAIRAIRSIAATPLYPVESPEDSSGID